MTTLPAGRPEDRARANIDRLLTGAGWQIQNRDNINLEAGRGIAARPARTPRPPRTPSASSTRTSCRPTPTPTPWRMA